MWNKILKLCIYLLVVLMPLFFLPFSYEALEFNKSYLLLILSSLGILAWVGKMIFEDKEIRFKRSPLDLFVLAYLLIVGLTVVFSRDKGVSLFGYYGRFFPSFLSTAAFVAFYFLITNNVKIKDDKAKKDGISLYGLIKAFFISAMGVVVIGYLSFFDVFSKLTSIKLEFLKIPQVMLIKGFNTIGSSSFALSVFLAIVFVFLVSFMAFHNLSSGKKGKNIFFYVLGALILGMLMLLDVFLSFLVIACCLFVFIVFSLWKRIFKSDVNRLALSIVLVIVSLIFLLSNPLSSIISSNFSGEVILSQKTSLFLAIEELKENPFFGSGISNFSYLFSKFIPQRFMESDFWQVRFDRGGNNFAEVLGTTGVLGIVSYLILILVFLFVSIFVVTSKIKPGEKMEKHKEFLIPLVLGFVAIILSQIFYYENLTLAFLFWFFLAMSIVSLQKPIKEKVFTFNEFPEVALVINISFWLIIIGLIISYFILGKNYVADAYYKSYLLDSGNIERLKTSTVLSSNNTVYHVILSRAYLQKASDELLKKASDRNTVAQYVSLAINEAKAAEALSPNLIAVRENMAIVYRDVIGVVDGALDWSIKTMDAALVLEPNNPILITELGKLYILKGNNAKAKELFEKAISVKPTYADSTIQLAVIEENSGNSEGAAQRLSNLLSLNPSLIEPRFQLGRIYYNQREYVKATEQLETTLQLFPNHSNSLYLLGLVYEKRGDKARALQLLQKVLELNPDSQEIKDRIKEIQGSSTQNSKAPGK